MSRSLRCPFGRARSADPKDLRPRCKGPGPDTSTVSGGRPRVPARPSLLRGALCRAGLHWCSLTGSEAQDGRADRLAGVREIFLGLVRLGLHLRPVAADELPPAEEPLFVDP